MKVAGAPEALTGLRVGTIFAQMMDNEHGDIEVTLQRAKEAEDGGNLTCVVLVNPVQPDERIEHQQAWSNTTDSASETILIGRAVNANRWSGNDIERERIERNTPVLAETQQTCFDDRGCILGHIEHDPAGIVDGKAIETGCTARDRQR